MCVLLLLLLHFLARITFGHYKLNLHDTTNPITEIPEVGVQLPEWSAIYCTCMYMTVYKSGVAGWEGWRGGGGGVGGGSLETLP